MLIEARTAADTRAVGRRLATIINPGDVVSLTGDLGAGKTVFVGGLAEGLGVSHPVLSPTFGLMQIYSDGFVPLVHVDTYRLSSVQEFEDLEARALGRAGVLVVEWGDRVVPALGPNRLDVEMTRGDGETRSLTFQPRGTWADRGLGGLA